MRSDFVVASEPVVRDLLDIWNRLKQVRAQYFLPIAAIEALDERVLVGLAGLDEADFDAPLPGPVGEGLAGEFGTVVAADGRDLPLLCYPHSCLKLCSKE